MKRKRCPSLIPHPSALRPPPSALIPHPSSLIPHLKVAICKSLAQLLDGLLVVRLVHYIGDLIRIDFQIVKFR
jgi:hypothetical protein